MNIELISYKINENDLPGQWIKEWKDAGIDFSLSRSSSSLCLYLKLGNCKLDFNELKNRMRDQVLDIGDWSASKGYRLPLVCVVESKNDEDWRKLSGDQEWLQGQWSLQSTRDEKHSRALLELFLCESMADVGEVQPKTDMLLSKEIEKALASHDFESNDLQREILSNISESIVNPQAVAKLEAWEQEITKEYEAIMEGGK
ncbi:MAG: hypothetical protein EOM12_05295 [Verrucomicrobiae bacterium]|nr:hypothetical protein [Verrucomicrobiae bacterium]